MATYGIFGWIFTLYRAATSMIIAIIAGILTNIFDNDIETEETKIKKPSFSAVAPQQARSFSMHLPKSEERSKKFSFIAAIK